MAVFMFFLQGIISLPFHTMSVHAKESKKYYEEEEDDNAWERQPVAPQTQPSPEVSAYDASVLALQQELEQQRQQQQQLLQQQAVQKKALEEQQNALSAADASPAGANNNPAYLDTDHDGIADAVDPHPGENEAIYDVRDENKNGISDEIESTYAAAWR